MICNTLIGRVWVPEGTVKAQIRIQINRPSWKRAIFSFSRPGLCRRGGICMSYNLVALLLSLSVPPRTDSKLMAALHIYFPGLPILGFCL